MINAQGEQQVYDWLMLINLDLNNIVTTIFLDCYYEFQFSTFNKTQTLVKATMKALKSFSFFQKSHKTCNIKKKKSLPVSLPSSTLFKQNVRQIKISHRDIEIGFEFIVSEKVHFSTGF